MNIFKSLAISSPQKQSPASTNPYHPYCEISIYASVPAIMLSILFHYARFGVADPMTGDIIKALGFSLLLINLPYVFSSTYRLQKSNETWYRSQAFIAVAALFIFTFAGFLFTDINYNYAYFFSVPGYALFVLSLYRYITDTVNNRTIIKSIICIGIFSGFSLWIAGVIWGYFGERFADFILYASPFFIERIYSGGVVLDPLFNCATAQMLQTYNVSSTGLDGLPYVPYHVANHWIFAQVSKLLNITIVQFYQLCYPVIFIPLFFYGIFLLALEARNLSSPTEHAREPLFNIFSCIAFVAAFIPFLPGRLPNIFAMGFQDIAFLSQSYTVSLIFMLFFFCLLLSFWKNLRITDKIRPDGFLFLFAIVPLLVASICMSKISIFPVIFPAILYVIIRLGIWKQYQFLLALCIAPLVFLTSCYFTLPINREDIATISCFAFVKRFFLNPQGFLNLFFYYFWAIACIIVGLCTQGITNKKALANSFAGRHTVGIEIILIIGGVGFVPLVLFYTQMHDASYFSGIQKWVALPLLIASLSCINIRSKSVLAGVILCFSAGVFFMYVNAEKQINSYCTLIDQIRHQTINTTSPRYRMLQLLQDLNRTPLIKKRNTLLFIPQSTRAYWDIAESVSCYSVPFVAPAISGIALLDGLPEVECGDEQDRILKNNGFDSYQLRETHQTEKDTTRETLCKKALVKNFKNIIKIEETPEGLKKTEISCE